MTSSAFHIISKFVSPAQLPTQRNYGFGIWLTDNEEVQGNRWNGLDQTGLERILEKLDFA